MRKRILPALFLFLILLIPAREDVNAQSENLDIRKITRSGNVIFWKTLNYDETSLFIYLDSVYGAYYLVKDAGQWSVPVPIATPFDDGNGLDITGLEIDVFLTNQNRIAFLWVDEQGQLNMAETWIRYLEFDYQWEMSFIGDNVLGFEALYDEQAGGFKIVYFHEDIQDNNQLLFTYRNSNSVIWNDPTILLESPYFNILEEFPHKTSALDVFDETFDFSWINPINSNYQSWKINRSGIILEQEDTATTDAFVSENISNLVKIRDGDQEAIVWETNLDGQCRLNYGRIENQVIIAEKLPLGDTDCLTDWHLYNLENEKFLQLNTSGRNYFIEFSETGNNGYYLQNMPLYILDNDINQLLGVNNFEWVNRPETPYEFFSLINGDIWIIRADELELMKIPEEILDETFTLLQIAHSHNRIDSRFYSFSETYILNLTDLLNDEFILIYDTDQLINNFYAPDYSGKTIPVAFQEYENQNYIYYWLTDENQIDVYREQDGELEFYDEIIIIGEDIQIVPSENLAYLLQKAGDENISIGRYDLISREYEQQISSIMYRGELEGYEAIIYQDQMHVLIRSVQQDDTLTWKSFDPEQDLIEEIFSVQSDSYDNAYFTQLQNEIVLVVETHNQVQIIGSNQQSEFNYSQLDPMLYSSQTSCLSNDIFVMTGLDAFDQSLLIQVENIEMGAISQETISLNPELDFNQTELTCLVDDQKILVYFAGPIDRSGIEPLYVDLILTTSFNASVLNLKDGNDGLIEEPELVTTPIVEDIQENELITPDNSGETSSASQWIGIAISLIAPIILVAGFVIIRLRKNR